VLGLPADVAEQATDDGVELLDPEGVPLARVRLEQTYDLPDGRIGVVGPVQPVGHHEFGPFRRFYRRPDSTESWLGVPVVAPLTTDAIDRITAAANEAGLRPLLVACVGTGTPHGLSGPGLLRATLAAAALIPGSDVVAAPVARRHPSGPDTDDDRRLRAFVVGRWSHAFHDPVLTGDLPPQVQAVVDQDRPPRHRRGVVVLFTGLSGSGKSTIARALVDRLLERGDRTVTSLDGDVVRHHLSKGLGFGREDRETNIRRIGWVAAEISRHGGVAICSPIAPFDSTRREVRGMVDDAGGGFVLVHVATPLEECERRDRKGLYARARRGEIPDFTGISSPYEEPVDAAVRIDTTGRDIEGCVDEVQAVLHAEGWLA
jgi:sulfate adenylyltransferase